MLTCDFKNKHYSYYEVNSTKLDDDGMLRARNPVATRKLTRKPLVGTWKSVAMVLVHLALHLLNGENLANCWQLCDQY